MDKQVINGVEELVDFFRKQGKDFEIGKTYVFMNITDMCEGEFSSIAEYNQVPSLDELKKLHHDKTMDFDFCEIFAVLECGIRGWKPHYSKAGE